MSVRSVNNLIGRKVFHFMELADAASGSKSREPTHRGVQFNVQVLRRITKKLSEDPAADITTLLRTQCVERRRTSIPPKEQRFQFQRNSASPWTPNASKFVDQKLAAFGRSNPTQAS
ncbi:hypothetical protein AYO20_09408 [Fonsecaea nubica]|uniref:Uncharacterized protein n=1 Tax=Fonsecaea nubica TaxID=856822 RepID=A0A178CH67_9EURO|nr:hypothetical protein AYO20_09408 [Fonsecaea nubica]OAL28684.1 hypothetical protein AYO20_09408 [Fonsecaea nubica]